jgi:membrane-bound lytic murein transglycosylase F
LKKTHIKFLIIILLTISVGLGFYFFISKNIPHIKHRQTVTVSIPQNDVEENIEVLRVIMMFHAADYFIYKGTPIGFQYELLKELEKALGINMVINIETDASNIPKEVYRGNFDIAIMDLPQCNFLLPLFERSIPHSYSHPVLVSGKTTDTANSKKILVSNDFFAILFFDDDSPYSNYQIRKTNEYSTEELFEQVENGEIQYMICDYNQAITLMPFYSNVRILEKAGPEFERRWILNHKNVQLNENINHWLLDFKKTKKYRYLLRKYFTSTSSLLNSSFSVNQKKGISPYDAIIQKYAQQYGFDWRFVASIMYQESKFIAGLTGKGGSYGLMQMMPVTMEHYGISENDDHEAHIRAGVKHLNRLRNYFDDIEEEKQLYFIAAAYNAGSGHIFDARRLCDKYNEDYTDWQNVAKYLKLKSHRDIVADSVVRNGYFPGAHTVNYTQQVMNRYEGYKAAFPE